MSEPFQCPDCKRIDGVTEGYCPWCLRGDKPSTTAEKEERQRLVEKGILSAPKRASSCKHCGEHKLRCICLKASQERIAARGSQEAYLTTVTISRYNDRATEDMRAGIEDEYSFEIGLRTFPEVLTLVDDIKHHARKKIPGG